MRARLAWLLPLLRWSIALVWIVTAIVSFGVYPMDDSYALLAQAGVPSALLGLALYGAALMDLVLGVCALLPRRVRWLWLAQLALVLGYTAIITLRLPEFWLIHIAGFPMSTPWLVWSMWLYALAIACWLPVVWLQMRLRDVAAAADRAGQPLPRAYWRYFGWWVALGIPAFFAFLAIFYLMVSKGAGL